MLRALGTTATLVASGCATERLAPPTQQQVGDCATNPVAVLAVSLSPHWNLPIAEARINDASVSMIVDTGAESVLVTPDIAAALNLPRDPDHSSIVRGIAGETELDNARIHSLELGGLVLRGGSVPVGPLPVSEIAGRPLAGVIGADVLSGFDVDFDLPGQAVRLYSPGACRTGAPAWTRLGTQVAANRTDRGRLFVPVRIDGRLLLAMLDSGFSNTTVTTRAASRLGITASMLEADPPAGVTRGIDLNDRPNRWHRFAEIRVAGEVLRDQPVIVADLPTSGVDMLLGADFLQVRRLWLDYAGARVVVERPAGLLVSALS